MEFILPIDFAKFRSTNSTWNSLMLNDPWSVGYVTTLIELIPFVKKEDWEDFYYNSGEERELHLLELDGNTQKILQDELLIKNNKSTVLQMGYDLKNFNTQYGRTKLRLYKKGEILFEAIKNNGFGLTVDECFECIRFRVICETWNGVIVREHNTIQTLKKQFPNSEFRKVCGEVDYKYAVDYEIYKNGILKSAIQIKPKSYTMNAPYIQKARYANKNKNMAYFNSFNVSVFDVISDSKGIILNPDVLKNL